MSDMKCPFCQQKLVYDSGIEQWCCDKCHLGGGYNLWQALIDTKKKLDIAVDALIGIEDGVDNLYIAQVTAGDALEAIDQIKEIKGE